MKVYVDTCVLGTVVDREVAEPTLDALGCICDMELAGTIRLVTSEETIQELCDHADKQKRTALRLVYALGHKTPWQDPVVESGATWGSFNWGSKHWGQLPKYDETLERLREVFDENDARHIFQAIGAGCKYFLTLDERTVLARARQHPDRVPEVRFVNPPNLVRELTAPS